MASEVDISNLALSHLGDEATVTAIRPPDGSSQAAQCGRFYPIARDLLLEAHPWTFATKRVALATIDNPSPDDWAYAYRLPAGCIRPLSALLPGVPEQLFSEQSDAGTHPYIVEADSTGAAVLYTNVDTAVLRYIDRVTDSTRFTPGFVAALARLMAAYLSGPVVRGEAGVKMAGKQMEIFAREYAKAAATDSNTGRRNLQQSYVPSFIAARGGITRVPPTLPQ